MDIIELKAKGHSIREIARLTGFSRNTVRKYIKLREVPKVKPRAPRPSKLDPFKPYLVEQMNGGVFNCNRLLIELQAQGYAGGKTILKDFVKPFRPRSEPKAVIRFETQPGEQAQVDFGSFLFEDQRGKHRISAFVMVLSYSRAMSVEFVERQDLSTLLRCIIHAFEAMGGIPQTVLFDNLKPVVLGRDAAGQAQWNQRFLDFAMAVGFRPKACRPYRAQTKGRVERSIGYLRQHFWPGRVFTDLADLNRQVQAWVMGVANQRNHGTTGRRPMDLLQEERLQPLPPATYWTPYLFEERKVGRDGFVSYDRSRYGVPWRFAGQTVEVREMEHHVEILSNGTRIVLHPRAVLPGTQVPFVDQWEGISLGDSARLRKAVALRIPSPEVEVRPLSVYDSIGDGGVTR